MGAELIWETPTSDGGSAITAYQRRRDDGTGTFQAWADVGLVLTETITGLTNGLTYQFEVRAVNNEGESPASNTASATAGLGDRFRWGTDQFLWGTDKLLWAA